MGCLAGGLAGCSGNHHVSPWGEQPGPSLAAFLRPPDLEAQLALVDAETAALGLTRTDEIRVDRAGHDRSPGSGGAGFAAVIRGYVGRDAAGRTVHAVRVATPRGVVLALGPLDAGDVDRGQGTELVPALAMDPRGGVAFGSGTDLNGDGAPDVVVRNEAGEISIWRYGELGSGAYGVTMRGRPTRSVDADGDGRIDLWSQLPADPRDPLGPELTDVATFAAGAYSDDTAAARAWHARQAAVPTPASTKVSDVIRLRAAVERAWHRILAGEPKDGVLRDLAREPAPAALRAALDDHQRRLAALTPR